MIGSPITVTARSDDIVTIIHAEVVPGGIDAEFLNGMRLRFVNHILQIGLHCLLRSHVYGKGAQHKVRIFFVWDFFKHHSCLILWVGIYIHDESVQFFSAVSLKIPRVTEYNVFWQFDWIDFFHLNPPFKKEVYECLPNSLCYVRLHCLYKVIAHFLHFWNSRQVL